MSGYNNQSGSYGDDFDHQDGASGGGLRKQLEEALAELKEARRLLGKEDRDKTAEQALKDKGLDPALKDIIPDNQDPKAWVEQYAPLLGAKPQAQVQEEEVHEEPESQASQEEDPALVAEREALAQIQGAADAGSPAHISGDVLERMDKIQSEEELMLFFSRNGAAEG